MILYEKGLWKLDDPVTKFIPEFAHLKVLNGTGPDGKPILVDAVRPPNMRELMTHTAGFGYGLRSGNPVDDAFRAQKVLASNGLHDMITKIANIPLLYQRARSGRTRWRSTSRATSSRRFRARSSAISWRRTSGGRCAWPTRDSTCRPRTRRGFPAFTTRAAHGRQAVRAHAAGVSRSAGFHQAAADGIGRRRIGLDRRRLRALLPDDAEQGRV